MRIARWEVSRGTNSFDRRTAAVTVVVLLVAGGVFGGLVASGVGSVGVDSGLYRVGVAADSPYHDPVADTSALAARPPAEAEVVDGELRGGVDLLVRDGAVLVADSQKGQAALSTFRDAVARYNDRRLGEEPNRGAAFPVLVTLRYAERDSAPTLASAGGRSVDDGSSGSEASSDSSDAGEPGASGDSGGDGSSGASGSADSDDAESGGTAADSGADGGFEVPGLGSGVLRTESTGSPADISPPFPFGSLVLAFAFLVPMNFVAQAYGGSVLNERVNRRGEPLLVTPVGPGTVVAGKTLPYVLGLTAVSALVALLVGGGPLSVAAVVPIALLYLAATFLAAMFARSFKELTFLTVTVSVFLTSYAFVPAVFADVTPISLISPLTLVVRDLQGTGATLGQYLFSAGPFVGCAAVLFLLGVGVYREEDMFTQRAVPLKALDALDARIRGKRSMLTLAALSIPFVLVAELLVVAVLFVLPLELSLPVLFVAIAAVEELAKSLHVYAGFAKARFARTVPTALVLGALSGTGFFLGEKLFAVVQVVGLPSLTVGRAAFESAGAGIGPAVSPATALALLLAPLALHVVTAATTATGASRGREAFAGAFVLATLLHAGYNLAVATVVSGLV
nr:PrsW family intramembrane metalloprotease [Halobium salinum]